MQVQVQACDMRIDMSVTWLCDLLQIQLTRSFLCSQPTRSLTHDRQQQQQQQPPSAFTATQHTHRTPFIDSIHFKNGSRSCTTSCGSSSCRCSWRFFCSRSSSSLAPDGCLRCALGCPPHRLH